MVFNSLHFVWFFVVVYALYRVLPHRAQNWLLLVASYYFYAAWDWRFLGLLVASTLASPAVSLLYIACFGVGAVLGMAALSAAISLPLRHTAGVLGGAHSTLETLVGLGALGIGVWVVYAAAGPF